MGYTASDGTEYAHKPIDGDPGSRPKPPDGVYEAKCSFEVGTDKEGHARVILEWNLLDGADPAWNGATVKDFYTFFDATHPRRNIEADKLQRLRKAFTIPPMPQGLRGTAEDFADMREALDGRVATIKLQTSASGFQNIYYTV